MPRFHKNLTNKGYDLSTITGHQGIIQMTRNSVPEENQPPDNLSQPAIDPYFAGVFVSDASKALAILEAIATKNDYGNEENMRAYIINVHGMKSATAVMGRMDLAATAGQLEMAGREGNLELILSKTPAFIRALRAFVEELTPPEDDAVEEMSDEDKARLREKLLVIKTACEEYDESTADEVISELNKTTWPKPVRELLNQITEYLLHCDFEEIVGVLACACPVATRKSVRKEEDEVKSNH